jgi:protein TonB
MNTQLTFFLTASLAVHAGLLYQNSEQYPLQPAIGGEAQALSITVVKPAQQPVRQKAFAALDVAPRVLPVDRRDSKRNKLITADNTDIARPDAPAKASATSTAEPTTAETMVTRTATPEPAAPDAYRSSAIKVNEYISAALQNRLASRFEYPWLARKRGWQGQVTLSLQIDNKGDLSNWQISRTSGYGVLDRSALKAAKAIRHLPEAEDLLKGQPLDLMIPVHYQLLDS